MSSKDLFPGFPIPENEKAEWDAETQRIKEAWELGKKRNAHRHSRLDSAPYTTSPGGKAFA